MAKSRKASYVIGLDQFERKIQQQIAKLDDKTIDEALFEGGMVILLDAQGRIDDVTGNLKSSGYVTTESKSNYTAGKRRNKEKKATKRAAVVRFSARYAHMVEFGTARHAYGTRRRGMTTRTGEYAKSVNHPGARAKPFLRPAYDSKKDHALRVIERELEKALK